MQQRRGLTAGPHQVTTNKPTNEEDNMTDQNCDGQGNTFNPLRMLQLIGPLHEGIDVYLFDEEFALAKPMLADMGLVIFYTKGGTDYIALTDAGRRVLKGGAEVALGGLNDLKSDLENALTTYGKSPGEIDDMVGDIGVIGGTQAQLDDWFRYHRPKEGQAQRYEAIRAAGKRFAVTVTALCPDSSERDAAIQHIREAVYNANAAIACNE